MSVVRLPDHRLAPVRGRRLTAPLGLTFGRPACFFRLAALQVGFGFGHLVVSWQKLTR